MDNWNHRSANMRCMTCMWYAEKPKSVPDAKQPGKDIDENVKFGRCRRHAPTMSGFPAVFGDDWCGDHKLDENTL